MRGRYGETREIDAYEKSIFWPYSLFICLSCKCDAGAGRLCPRTRISLAPSVDAVLFDPATGLFGDRPAFNTSATDPGAQVSMGFFQYHDGGELVNFGHSGSQQKARTEFYCYPIATPSPYSLYAMSNSENASPSDAIEALRAAFKPELPLDADDSCLASPAC